MKAHAFGMGLTRGFFSHFTTRIFSVVKKYSRACLASRSHDLGGQRWPSTGDGPEERTYAGASAAKREGGGVARGRWASHATIRSTLIAAAMATCCIWVLAKPRYRVRRNPNAPTPCASVPFDR